MSLFFDNPLPEMTWDQKQAWKQPDAFKMKFESGYVYMWQKAFDELREYSTTFPSGVYDGKMWKRKEDDAWLLCWFSPHPTDENLCIIVSRKILLMELVELLQPSEKVV